MFVLHDFLPYRLSLLSQTISGVIASEYKEKFGLSMTDWRCLVIIQNHQPITARQIGSLTRLEKMAISRSIAKLLKQGLIKKTDAENDGRAFLLHISKEGRQIYREILPLAQSYEARLVSGLNKKEIQSLKSIIDKLQTQAEQI